PPAAGALRAGGGGDRRRVRRPPGGLRTAQLSRTADMLRIQAEWCARLGPPCGRAADDVEAGGPTAAVLEGHEDDRPASALALRLMGAVHRLVLSGEAPGPARLFPCGGGGAVP